MSRSTMLGESDCRRSAPPNQRLVTPGGMGWSQTRTDIPDCAEGVVKIWLNDEEREIPNSSTIADLLNLLSLEPGRVAVELNLDIVPRNEQGRRVLRPGDRVEIVTLVGGGADGD